MKTWLPFSMLTAMAMNAAFAGDTTGIRFVSPPLTHRFPDGITEWEASVWGSKPESGIGIKIRFFLDRDFDGFPENLSDSVSLDPGTWDAGKFQVFHTFPLAWEGMLVAEIWDANQRLDKVMHFLGSRPSLSIRRFCASPEKGEPEWLEVQNTSALPVYTGYLRLQDHGWPPRWIAPQSTLVLGPDSTLMRNWMADLPLQAVVPWKNLRNTGDTVRLTFQNVVLDSALYGLNMHEPRAACLSSNTNQTRSGISLETSPPAWNPSYEDLEVSVQVPVDSRYSVQAFDLDGQSLCWLVRQGVGSQHFSWHSSDCPLLAKRRGAILLQLKMASSKPVRKLIPVRF